MKYAKKLQALLVALVMTLSMLPNPALASGGIMESQDAMLIPGASATAGGAWQKAAAAVRYGEGEKSFTDDRTYVCTPYKEIKLESNLGDYEKLELYLGLDANSASETDGAQVTISKWKQQGSAKLNWAADTITFNCGDSARKISLELDGFDSVQFTVKENKAEVSDGKTVNVVFGDFTAKAIALEKIERPTQAQFVTNDQPNYATTRVGGISQMLPYSWTPWLNAHNSGRNYIYYESPGSLNSAYPRFEAGRYSAVEFNMGYETAKTTNTTGEYYVCRIFIQSETGARAYHDFTVYQDMDAQKVILPLDPQACRMQFQFTRYLADGTPATTSTCNGSFVAAITDLKFYTADTTVNSFLPANDWSGGFYGTKTSFPDGLNDNWQYAELYLNYNVQSYNVTAHNITMPGVLIAKNKGVAATGTQKEDYIVANGVPTGYYKAASTFMTGKTVDRLTGYLTIPNIDSNAAVPATAADYVAITGYNYADGARQNINQWKNETLLYEVKGMNDNFCEYFDIDVSQYDFIKIVSHMPCKVEADNSVSAYRYAGLCDMSVSKYADAAIETFYDEDAAAVYAQSPKLRDAGTLIAVSYAIGENGNEEKGIAINNSAVFGSASLPIVKRGGGTQDATVIKPEGVDISGISEGATFMKVYWVDHTVESAANLAETGAAETDYLATFIISSDTADIESVGALPALRVAQGTIFEDIPLPDSVSVYVGDTEYKGIGVTWNKSGYNEGVPAVYTLTGALNTDDLLYRNLSNKQNLTAAVQVTVEEKEIIKENYSYSDVQLGGGGFVTGIVFHPLNPNLGYARTDVGGAYRFDRTTGKWTCISDWLPHNNMFGIDAIAVDPNDENVVYMQAGTYWYKQGHALYKSTDKGETWTDISFTNDSRVFSGNSVNRMAGEALAVDPNNANIIYSGTRINGLWVTKNGGSSWTKTTLPVTSLDKGNACTGIRSVAVDDVDGNSVAYAAVYGYSDIAGGVYQSTDNGTTWTLLAGSPDKPLNLKVFNHDVYVSSGEMLNSSVAASFYKFDSTAGEWIDMTPEGLESAGSFDVYENEAGQAVIYLAESKKGASIYKKIGEEAWVKEFTAETITCDVSESASWFTDKFSQLLGIYAYTGDLIIVDNSGTKEMWITDGGVGIWYNADVENSNAFSSKVSGVDVLSMVSMNIPVDSASANKIWTTNYDYGIIASSDVTDSKAAKMYRKFKDYSWFGKVYDIDTCDADANFIAFTTSVDGEQVVGLSSNGGKTMHYGDYYPEYSTGKLAVSSVKNADGVPNIVTIPYGTDAAVMYSVDFNSWAYSDIPAGLLTDTRYNIIDSDTVNANVFYIYDAANAKVYTSYDAGETFTGTDAALLRGADITHGGVYIPTIAAKPGVEGEVWISNSKGLFKSTDYGATFTKASEESIINNVKGFAFGKGLTDAVPAVFVLGSIDGVYGLFRSDDNGATWIQINDEDVSLQITVAEVAGDMNVYGRVYLATAGRGVVMFDKDSTLPFVVTETEESYIVELNQFSGNAQVIAAIYEGNSMKTAVIGDAKNIDGTGTLTVAKPQYQGDGITKIFIWDSMDGMKPIYTTTR